MLNAQTSPLSRPKARHEGEGVSHRLARCLRPSGAFSLATTSTGFSEKAFQAASGPGAGVFINR
jgi:hypothetical protein